MAVVEKRADEVKVEKLNPSKGGAAKIPRFADDMKWFLAIEEERDCSLLQEALIELDQ
ncbi:hypothetical protein J6590_026175 [Homalodisca vitripennis]|nr:hypothetical protein J6590_026175 [Homalodisca vitripennis]